MSALRKSYLPAIEVGNYNYKSMSFISKAATVTALSGLLAVFNLVPVSTFM